MEIITLVKKRLKIPYLGRVGADKLSTAIENYNKATKRLTCLFASKKRVPAFYSGKPLFPGLESRRN